LVIFLITAATAVLLDACKQCPPEPGAAPLGSIFDDFSNTTPYTVLPPTFPPMYIPDNNPLTEQGVLLGRYLFYDKMLSGDNTLSCSGCHKPEHAFGDNNQFSEGVHGELGDRQSMALINIGWAEQFFWDGRALGVEAQVHRPVNHVSEMDQPWQELLVEISETELYPPLYQAAFGSKTITKDRTAKALASFMRAIVSYDSNYDKAPINYTLTELEQYGFDLFISEGGYDEENDMGTGADCFHCHSIGAKLFTDNLPHNNGLDSVWTDLGYFYTTGDSLQMGAFKTPTLRNISLTSPYMHDGRFTTLEEVVDHYNSGGVPSATIDPFMKYTEGGLHLTQYQKDALIAFLHTLTDEGFTTNPLYSDPHE
jgi:cytochrome c peroxidase